MHIININIINIIIITMLMQLQVEAYSFSTFTQPSETSATHHHHFPQLTTCWSSSLKHQWEASSRSSTSTHSSVVSVESLTLGFHPLIPSVKCPEFMMKLTWLIMMHLTNLFMIIINNSSINRKTSSRVIIITISQYYSLTHYHSLITH